VAEADDYLVVDKPPFLLVHPSKPAHGLTLWGELRNLLAFELANGGQISIVNRLDRETSGVVLVAKTTVAARRFGLAMQRQQIGKEYLAIVWGWPEWDEKLVEAPLVRHGTFAPSAIWLKQAIHPSGAPAATMLRVERRFRSATSNGENFSVVLAIPLSGRTHQIRVHLASAGHPIVGDKIYGPDERLYLRFIERAGRRSSNTSSFCRGMRCTLPKSQSKVWAHGRARSRRISPPSRARSDYCVSTAMSAKRIILPPKLCSVASWRPPNVWYFSHVPCIAASVSGT